MNYSFYVFNLYFFILYWYIIYLYKLYNKKHEQLYKQTGRKRILLPVYQLPIVLCGRKIRQLYEAGSKSESL